MSCTAAKLAEFGATDPHEDGSDAQPRLQGR